MIVYWLVLGYFIVLFAERAQSLVRTFTDSDVSAFGTGFDRYVNILTILSLVGFIILLVTINRDFIAALTNRTATVDMKCLSITIGVILLGGMVHTEHTIAPVQFGAYGLLIAALVIFTAKNNALSGNRVLLWMSLVYLILFSMAIPVMYRSKISNAVLFHVIEAVVAVALVTAFTYMTFLVLSGNATNLFLIVPIAIAVVGDAAILLMRWNEKVNTFVLIFIFASAVMWIVGKITAVITK